MKAGHRLKAGDLRDRLLQTHCFIKETAKSRERLAQVRRVSKSLDRVRIKAKSNTIPFFQQTQWGGGRTERAREYPCSSYFWARNFMNGSKQLFLNAKNSEFSNQPHPYLYTAKLYSRTKYTLSAKALIKLSVIEWCPPTWPMSYNRRPMLNYITLYFGANWYCFQTECYLQRRNGNYFCDS